MLSISSLIDFILKLLQDAEAQAEFARDPEGMLARNGLQNLSAQDVCDAAPIVADHPAVSAKHDGHQPLTHHDDPVGALAHMKEHYVVNKTLVTEKHYDLTYVDDRDTIVNVDDRDTTSIQAEGDVNIEDSFNQDNDVNVAQDSFNQDNDGVDNKDGSIEQSAVAGTSDPEKGSSKHGSSDDDDSEPDHAGSGPAKADPSSDSTADPDSSGLAGSDPADHGITEADESSVDPSEIDEDDSIDEDHAGDEFHLVG